MFGMAQAVGDLAEQGAPAFEAAQPVLAQLLKAETAEREVRSVAYQLKAARFPAYRDSGWLRVRRTARSTKRWCGSCTAVSSWSRRRTSCWSAGRAPARPTWPRRSACRPSSITAPACPLLLHRRAGQRAGAGEAEQQDRPDGSSRSPTPTW